MTIKLVACMTILGSLTVASAAPPVKYAARAPLAQYMDPEKAEILLAQSAAPASIALKADVMALGEKGYRTVTKGTNGFVCMVWRSWSDDLADPQFWNPKVRAPICLNPISVRTVLPGYLQRTDWVLSGLSREDMQSKFKLAASRNELPLPAPGAMSYMLSHKGYLADGIGPASPHIMFFVPRADKQDWGANLPESPISGADGDPDPVAIFFVMVAKWSDGTPAAGHAH